MRHGTAERGFTMLELMIALTVLLIGIAGIVGMQMSAMRASAYSRHATEASVLAEDKMEELRTVPLGAIVAASDTVDARGNAAPGPFTRAWALTWNGAATANLTVTVSWLERGSDSHSVAFTTVRTP